MSRTAIIYMLINGCSSFFYLGLLFYPVEIQSILLPYVNSYLFAMFVFRWYHVVFPHLVGLWLIGASFINGLKFLSPKISPPTDPKISSFRDKAVVYGLIGCLLSSLASFISSNLFSGDFSMTPNGYIYSLLFFIPIIGFATSVLLLIIFPKLLKPPKEEAPEQVQQYAAPDCPKCQGTGKCARCNGTGYRRVYGEYKCATCKGTGFCTCIKSIIN